MKRLVLLALLAACSSAPDIPEGAGNGLTVLSDRPAGVVAIEAPTWSVGDVLEFELGGKDRVSLRVESGPDDATMALVDDANGLVQLFDRGLGRQAEMFPNVDGAIRVLEPADVQCAWPLWVGKRWRSHFMLKAPEQAVAVVAEYHCDARETIEVPAGSFDCYRIWRTAHAADDAESERVTSVAWYAPEVGYFVRRLAEGVLTELAERRHVDD
ncbi:MAG: hypothetical protein KDB80_15650 [Planctomycetes bacterium]|nr:hypothetical protein [Planctomycetota bacterium]